MTKSNLGIVLAFGKGYKIINGEIYNPSGKLLKGGTDKDGYKFFSICSPEWKTPANIKVHRLVAYQKYGNKLFESDLVRHVDDDKSNNLESNIELGTFLENVNDVSTERWSEINSKKTKYSRKYSDSFIDMIKKYRNDSGESYAKISAHFNLPTPSVAYLIVNNKYREKFP